MERKHTSSHEDELTIVQETDEIKGKHTGADFNMDFNNL